MLTVLYKYNKTFDGFKFLKKGGVMMKKFLLVVLFLVLILGACSNSTSSGGIFLQKILKLSLRHHLVVDGI